MRNGLLIKNLSTVAALRQQAIVEFETIFTALRGMQTRSSDENSVRPFVCLSVKRVNCDKTVEKSLQIFTPSERSFCLVY